MTQPESDRTYSVVHSLDSDGSAELLPEADGAYPPVSVRVMVGIDPAEPVTYALVATDGTRAVILETGVLDGVQADRNHLRGPARPPGAA